MREREVVPYQLLDGPEIQFLALVFVSPAARPLIWDAGMRDGLQNRGADKKNP